MGGKRQAERALQRKPQFFKVLLGDFAQRLKMPPNFLKHVSDEASKKVILEGPNGCRWPVRIKRSSDGTFLSSGWSKFVVDHFLKESEFLVFQYEGNMHFRIQVFDTTASEREDLFAVQLRRKLNLTKGGTKRGRRIKCPLDVICHTEHQETKSGCLELITDGNHKAKHLQDDIINSIEGTCITSLSPHEDGKTKTEVEHLPVHFIGSETTRETGYVSRRHL